MRSCSATGLPRWLRVVLQDNFFNHCERHEQEKKKEKNLYCLKCSIQLCPHCLPHHQPPEHRVWKIRRHMYNSAVRLDDAAKFINCTSVQSYIKGDAKLVILRRNPPPNNSGGVGNYCNNCDVNLRHLSRFCSLYCKADYLLKKNADLSECFLVNDPLSLCDSGLDDDMMMPDSTVDTAGSTSTLTSLCSHVGVDITALACPTTTEMENLPTLVSVTSGSLRKRRRKRTPERSPLY